MERALAFAIKLWSSVTYTSIYYVRIAMISGSLLCEMTAYTFCIDLIVRGYCEYQSIWDNPLADGGLLCELEIHMIHRPWLSRSDR